MCLACWDADKMADKLKNTSGEIEVCDGLDMATMSLDELKHELMEEWLESSKTHYRVFKKAVPEAKKDKFVWQVSAPNDSKKKAEIHVSLI